MQFIAKGSSWNILRLWLLTSFKSVLKVNTESHRWACALSIFRQCFTPRLKYGSLVLWGQTSTEKYMFWRKTQWSYIDFWVPNCHRVFSTIAPVLRSPEGLHKLSKLDSWAWRPPVYYKIVHIDFLLLKVHYFWVTMVSFFKFVGPVGYPQSKQIDMPQMHLYDIVYINILYKLC